MDDKEINYKVLRKIQQMEKNSPILTKIEYNFYYELSKYLKYLNDRYKKEESSQKKILLEDEIRNTNKIMLNIYELREKKILLATVAKARGGNPNLENLVDIEKKLYDSILQMLLQHRNKFLDNKSIENNEETTSTVKEKKIKQVKNNSIIMIKEDIPEFIGTDMKKYNLRKGDIISLPKDMGDTLVKRDVVKEIK
jgi:DNA replication initiation complex subunit (GINS family)